MRRMSGGESVRGKLPVARTAMGICGGRYCRIHAETCRDFWELSEPVPAWGNLLRHAEGRLEPGTQRGMSDLERTAGVVGTLVWMLGDLKKAVIGNRWGVHDNFNAWDLNSIVWEFARQFELSRPSCTTWSLAMGIVLRDSGHHSIRECTWEYPGE